MSDPQNQSTPAPGSSIDPGSSNPDPGNAPGNQTPEAQTPESPAPESPAPEPGSVAELSAGLEAEIDMALGDISIEDLLDTPVTPTFGKTTPGTAPGTAPNSPTIRRKPPRTMPGAAPAKISGPTLAKPPNTRSGTIAAVYGDDVMVEFDPRTQGVCKLAQFGDEKPVLGAKMDFILSRYDKDDGLYILTRRGKVVKAEWELLEVGQIVEARCTGVNKGGLEMEIAKHQAFMPAGQATLKHIDDLKVFIGEKMPCEIIELDTRGRGRIILSRRAILKEEREEQRNRLLLDLEVGKTLSAVITSVQPYGAFADLGGIDGLIHISDMSHDRLKHPSDKVKEGDTVQVQILKMESPAEGGGKPKIGLGMKQLEEDPYKAAMAEIVEGAIVSGRVTTIKEFGAFVELAPGREGLIHISELDHKRVDKVSSVLKENEIVSVKILSIEPSKNRISLSRKATIEDYSAAGDGGQSGGGPRKGSGKGSGGRGRGRGRDAEPQPALRDEDPQMRKLKAMLNDKFGDNLKGGIG